MRYEIFYDDCKGCTGIEVISSDDADYDRVRAAYERANHCVVLEVRRIS